MMNSRMYQVRAEGKSLVHTVEARSSEEAARDALHVFSFAESRPCALSVSILHAGQYWPVSVYRYGMDGALVFLGRDLEPAGALA